MIDIPNMVSWMVLWERERDKLTDPKQRHMVDMVIEHSYLEAERDWDAVAPTMHEDAVYQTTTWNAPERYSNKAEQLKSYAESDAARPGLIARLEMETTHFLVNDEVVAWDGVLHTICKGFELAGWGIDLAEGDSPDDEYVVAFRNGLFIPFKDGLLLAEDSYSGKQATVAKLSPAVVRTRRAMGRIWAEL